MAGEQFADLAVASILSYFESDLQTYLTALETAQGLDAGDMTPPEDFVPADLPKDTRSPLLQCWSEAGAPDEREGNKGGIYVYRCIIRLDYVGDNAETVQLFLRRYMSALLNTLRADYTLGGTVIQAVDGEQNFDADAAGEAETRRAISLIIDVWLEE